MQGFMQERERRHQRIHRHIEPGQQSLVQQAEQHATDMRLHAIAYINPDCSSVGRPNQCPNGCSNSCANHNTNSSPDPCALH